VIIELFCIIVDSSPLSKHSRDACPGIFLGSHSHSHTLGLLRQRCARHPPWGGRIRLRKSPKNNLFRNRFLIHAFNSLYPVSSKKPFQRFQPIFSRANKFGLKTHIVTKKVILRINYFMAVILTTLFSGQQHSIVDQNP
jgi:hypothetical protein